MTPVTSLRDETIALYRNRAASLRVGDVAKAVDVSTHWLRKFAAGEIPNPGVVHVETLNRFLKDYKAANNV